MVIRILMIAAAATSVTFPLVAAEPWQAPDSPFMLGEAYPETPATCETVADWIDKSPEVEGRVSFAIVGKLVAAEWDGALAYLSCARKPTSRFSV